MLTSTDLQNLLARIDRRGYPAYKDTKGAYQFPGYVLSIDHVQGDPFAAPSRLSVRVSGRTAAFPPALYRTDPQRIALQDELTRRFGRQAEQASYQARGSGHSGLIAVSRCGQEVLERTACRLDPATGGLVLRLEVGFPANGRTINARELEKILFDLLPRCVQASLFYKNLDPRRLQAVSDLAEDQQYIRRELAARGLCAFVADGSLLPRASGISALPLKGGVPFCSPPELAVTLELPHRGALRGMGIPRGVTLIVGGGYHGKSTLLKALELGVYNHVSGDGREYVITDGTAVKIRAEDGRSIRDTDISMFINNRAPCRSRPRTARPRRSSIRCAATRRASACAFSRCLRARCARATPLTSPAARRRFTSCASTAARPSPPPMRRARATWWARRA